MSPQPLPQLRNPIVDELDGLSPAAKGAIAGAAQQLKQGIGLPQPSMPEAPTPLANPTAYKAQPLPSVVPSADTGPIPQPPAPTAKPLSAPTLQTLPPDQGSGISRIHNPFARHGLQILDAIGSTFLPALTMSLPGTALHHQLERRGLENQIGANNATAAQQFGLENTAAQTNAQIPHIGAQTEQAKAAAQKDLAEATAKEEPPKDEWTAIGEPIIDPAHPEAGPQLAQQNKRTGEIRYGQGAMGAKPTEKAANQDDEKLTPEQIAQYNAGALQVHQVVNPGEQLPEPLKLGPNATKGDLKRVQEQQHNLISGQEFVNRRDEAKANKAIAQGNLAVSQGMRRDAQTNALATSRAKPFQTQRDAINGQLDRIHDAQTMVASGSPEAVALSMPKVLTALVSGQGTGVRITQPELKSIANARLGGGYAAWFQKNLTGKALSDQQRKQLSGLMDDIAGRLRQKQQIASSALDEIGGASDEATIKGAEQKYRHIQDEMEKGDPAVKAYADAHFGGDIVKALTAIEDQRRAKK